MGAWRALGRALARHPHVRAECAALAGDSPWRRELAARRLGFVRAPSTRRALWRVLDQGPEPLRLAAIRALGAHRDGTALRWVLAHPQAFVRRSPRAHVALLAAFGPAALPVLATAIEQGTGDPAMDRAAIECLGLGAHVAARFAVERRLRDPDMEVRVAAARALGRMRAEDCGRGLLNCLTDPAWQVRALACLALGHIRASVGLLALPARLTDSTWWVRRHAAWALAQLGDEGRAELTRIAAASPDPYARDMARAALEGNIEAP